MRTLTLDLDTWDIGVNSAGQIALSNGPYAIAQDVANACRLFTNDAYYDPRRGVPHFSIELGRIPNPSMLREKIRQAALSVEGVVDAKIEQLTLNDDRVLTGDIRLTLVTGETANVAF